ncbi:hypothetical protein RSAG8_05734, partial [Rhizoctonia solani AG-8 WAC10335]
MHTSVLYEIWQLVNKEKTAGPRYMFFTVKDEFLNYAIFGHMHANP